MGRQETKQKKAKHTLSIAPYYGGKSKMAHFIAERLCYDGTDIFITPFGGMCRVLLNKLPHRMEIYNDLDAGLCALMQVLSDKQQASELIARLYTETEYSEEEFEKQKAIYEEYKLSIRTLVLEDFRQFLIASEAINVPYSRVFVEKYYKFFEKRQRFIEDEVINGQKSADAQSFEAEINEYIRSQITGEIKNFKIPKSFEFHDSYQKTVSSLDKYMHSLTVKIMKDEEFVQEFEKWEDRLNDIYIAEKRYGRNVTWDVLDENSVTTMDLAIATYVTYKMSRDGMGKDFRREEDYKANKRYLESVLKLKECAERLEGVQVECVDARFFLWDWEQFEKQVNEDWNKTNNPEDEPHRERYKTIWGYLQDPHVMMYCDPSYISVESEKKMLEGIDVDNVDSLSEAIRERQKNSEKKGRRSGGQQPKNLGKVYAASFDYEQQEEFLRLIQKSKCRVMISNYDLQLYNKYLNEKTGWRREEFSTYTSIGGKADNPRVEVIWYNY